MEGEDQNQPSGSQKKDESPSDPPKIDFLERAAAALFKKLDGEAKDRFRELHEAQALSFNPAVLPAGISATSNNTSLGGILRSLLSTHKGPLSNLTEAELTKALSDLKTSSSEPSDLIKVNAPSEFGSAEFTIEDQTAWRNWAKDSKHGMDLVAIFKFCTRYHHERQCKFSEKTLRDHLYILCPREVMSPLNSKVDRGFSLQRIFDDLLLITDSVMSAEEIKLEVERTLANPSDPIAALRSVLALLEKNPASNTTSLDSQCLDEAKRMVRRLGGNSLYGSVEALFLHRTAKDFLNYFDILKSVYPQELSRLAKGSKAKIHHVSTSEDPVEDLKPTIDTLTSALMTPFNSQFKLMRDEIQELKDRSSAAATARPVNSADPPPPPQAACNIDNDLARRLSLIEGQQQQLMLHNIQAQLPTPPQGARNKIKSDRSQRSRRNKPQDGSRPPYKLKLCGLHVSPNHSNQECRRQKAWPCPLHGSEHHAGQCHRAGDYIHIPNMTVYSTDSETAQLLCNAAGGTITPSDRPSRPPPPPDFHQAPRHSYPQYPQAPYTYAQYGPKVPTAPPAPLHYRPPLYEPRQAHPMDLASNAPMQLNHIPNLPSTNLPSIGQDAVSASSNLPKPPSTSVLGEKFSELSNLLRGYHT